MTTKKWIRGALLTAALAACQSGAPSGDQKDDPSGNADIVEALNELPDATVLMYSPDGVPQYIVGELGKIDPAQTDDLVSSDSRLRPALPNILKAFRLQASDLQLRKVNTDENGGQHYRYVQKAGGVDVIGGDLVVHVDVKGAITGVNGTARGDVPVHAIAQLSEAAATAKITSDARFAGFSLAGSRTVFVQANDGTIHKAYEQIVEGSRGADPARDKVYVSVETGEIVAVQPTIHFARNRNVYSANNGSSLPGTLRRSENQAATTDVDVNAAYDNSGATYNAYNFFFGRDSYNNAGATLSSTVHYSVNYCNAFWNGAQMVYGDGNASQNCFPLARSVDVAAHELTHAVTEYESNLRYSGEPGGLNESYSDIFGAFVEAYVDGGSNGTLAINSGTFLIGDEVLPPFLRNMCDPAADGVSRDIWTSTLGNVDVHYSSGPNNLVFCLLTKGGMHPRGKTTVPVPAIGMEKAARIFYKANVDILTTTSNYAAMRNAAISAAQQLGYDQATQDAVACGYAAIAVGTAPQSCGGGGPGPGPTDGTLSNGVPVTGIADSVVGQFRFWKLDVPAGQSSLTFTITGGSGDADMYVQFGNKPTTSVWQCRPYVSGNTETCTFTPPSAGTYWVGLNAYSAYSGVTLTGTYTGTSGDPYLSNNVPVTGITGTASSQKYWRVAAPGGRTVTVRISGGTGDADLYTRQGQRPTTTSYSCRPYASGNTETCTHTNAAAGDWYVMLRGYAAYSGVQLVASW